MFVPQIDNMMLTFNGQYQKALQDIIEYGEKSESRNGNALYERVNASFTFSNPMACLCDARDYSHQYLEGEFALYMRGDRSLEGAAALSKVWEKCSDDGETFNSNYGALIFHDRNEKHNTQFEHAVKCLINNKRSKKAVIVLYRDEHAYLSNDNPCTMFLRLHIDDKERLHMTAFMRSSDMYFGIPYDVPFFCFVQYAALRALNKHYPDIRMGTYTHIAGSLHLYERNLEAFKRVAANDNIRSQEEQMEVTIPMFDKWYQYLKDHLPSPDMLGMENAWRQSAVSECLKKKVGACITHPRFGVESVGNGGAESGKCATCVRDNPTEDKYYGDECPSVHAEMRCVHSIAERKNLSKEYCEECTVYVTHGPCDACLKILDLYGFKEVVYDKPYKTDYGHWPRIKVRKALIY